MRPQFTPFQLLALIFLLAFLVAIIQVGALTLAFEKLGLSQSSAMLLLFTSIMGSLINIPLFKIRAEATQPVEIPRWLRGMLRTPLIPFQGYTTIAINVGGCLLPFSFSLYLIAHSNIPIDILLLAIGSTTAISYFFSRPLHGIGIGMPILVAPLSSAVIAIMLYPENSAALAYVCGTLGVIFGADILRLKDIRKMGTPLASIGGAGTFDGIFVTGIVAVLLA